MPQHYLHPLFNARSVAVFGASEREDSVAGILFRNLRNAGYSGEVYPINPKHETLFGMRCYASASELPVVPELALIATPAHTVAQIMEACGQHGIRHAIVLSAGFREVGAEGAALEATLTAVAKKHGIRFIGPNCLGVLRPSIGLNATFSQGATLSGDLALVSQSGALCTAMLDWAETNGIGFSSVISIGASADLDFGEILDYLAFDTQTKGILLYIEGIRDARRFMSALRAAARFKPIVLVKVGRHATGAKAVQSHTGALVGSDAVFDALVRRAGVVRVNTILQLFASARALSTHIQPTGNRLAIVTNGGGPGVMATDRAVDLGVRMAELSPATIATLNGVLPSNWSQANPLDIIGDATAERYRAAVAACLADDNVDGVLAMLTPQAMTRPTEAAQAVIEVAKGSQQAGAHLLDGRGAGVRGPPPVQAGRHPLLHHAGTGGRGVFLPLRLLRKPAPADADAGALVAAGRAGRRRRAPDHRKRPGARSPSAERSGIEGAAGRFPHPDRADPDRARSHGSHADGAADGLSGGDENQLAGHHPQVRRQRRAAGPVERPGGALRLRRDARGREAPASRSHPRRHRDRTDGDPPARTRSAAGHDLGPGAGAGDRVRRRRRRCRSLAGPCGHPAAAQPLSGARPDPAHPGRDPAGAVPQPSADRYGCTGKRAAAPVGNGLRTALAGRTGHQPAAGGRTRRAGAGCPHRHRATGADGRPLWPHGDSSLPGASGQRTGNCPAATTC